jgi:hypothetical protein
MTLSEKLGLDDNQAFLLDYCSLPQQPRGPDETMWFHDHLPGFQSQFKYVTVVLNAGSADYSKRAWCMLELMLAAMNRSPRTTLLNRDRLDGPLRDARELAESYLKHSGWNEQRISKALGAGLTNATYAKWARDPVNVALYNASNEGRRTILEKFQRELAVTDPNDRPIIVGLLEQMILNSNA